MKKLVLTLTLALVSLVAFGQRTREADVAETWRIGLTESQIAAVDKLTKHMDSTDKWSVQSAVVRSKEFHADYLPGEPMTDMKVLAAVRTRLSTDDSRRFSELWSGLSKAERRTLIAILREIQTG